MHLLTAHTCINIKNGLPGRLSKNLSNNPRLCTRVGYQVGYPGTGHLITYPSNATRYAENLDAVIVYWSNPLLLQRNRKTEEVCLSCLVIGQRARFQMKYVALFSFPLFLFPEIPQSNY